MSAQQAVISTPLHGHFIFSSGRVERMGDHDFFLTFETLLFAGCALHVPNFAGAFRSDAFYGSNTEYSAVF